MVSLLTLLALAWVALMGATPAPPAQPPAAAAPASAPAPARRIEPSAATQALRSDLARYLEVPGWRAQFSVTVMSLDRGDTLFAHNPDLPLAPASNMKLYTTTAALYYLGPEYRYSTYVLTSGDLTNGVVNGDVVLYGTGDPSLSFRFHGNSARTMRDFADSLAALGVREIHGDVVGDGSYFRGYPAGYAWDPNYMNTSYAVPSGALSLNENLVTVRVSPGATPGSPAVVEGMPGGQWLAVQNEATTTAGGGASIDVRRWSYDGPIVVKGRIGRGAGAVTRMVVAADPAQYAAAAFREALADRGITVTGTVRAVHDSAQSPVTGRAVFASAFGHGAPLHVLTVYQSPPLEEILDILMHLSHNMFAEQTLRTVGRVAFGDGSAPGGHRAIMDMLQCETGLDTASLVLHQIDGSGLSPENRTTTRTMVRLLSIAARMRFFPALWETLPEAGHPHLARMQGTPAYDNLRAKTGTIDNVSSLSGYVRAADGERLAFSIISNGDPSTWKAKRVEDAIGGRLASFSRPEGELATPVGPEYRGAAAIIAPPAPGAAPETARPAAPQAGAPAPGMPQPVAPPTPQAMTPRVATPAAPGAPPAKAAPPALPALPLWHKIAAGETLSGIAQKYGISLSELRKANPGLSPRRIRPGQTLRLPSGASGAAPASTAAPPASASVAPAGPPVRSATPSPPVAPAGPAWHTVARGETLGAIARKYGTTLAALQAANPGVSPSRIRPGQKLRLPSGATGPSVRAPSSARHRSASPSKRRTTHRRRR